ncbi:MAG: substrate-binding domain-containing protein [Clostridiales bacterium]|nr:substrate-binding domain-containing protein [Clostridiales bacterium]
MKKTLSILLAMLLVVSLAACGAKTETDTSASEIPTAEALSGTQNPADSEGYTVAKKSVIRLSTTTSVNDSGLLPLLLPIFETETGYKVEVQSAGTGAAIQKAEDGNADLILVHAKQSEMDFVEKGYGVERIPFMYNYFVIVGPKNDPAGIKGSKDAADAFNKIRDAKSNFVSRGDESGTHKAELKIWGSDTPDLASDKWYISAGQGMGACLTMASEMQAYCLTDMATFLSMKDQLDLDILIDKSEDMKNTYSLIAVNPEKVDGVNTEGANALIEWMLGDVASALIESYGVPEYGTNLFFLLDK